MESMPKLLQQATAQLKDGAIVSPFASGHEDAFLTLSGVLFVGDTAAQRYVLHQHLMSIGVAGTACSNSALGRSF